MDSKECVGGGKKTQWMMSIGLGDFDVNPWFFRNQSGI
jgi:hypothetical protein